MGDSVLVTALLVVPAYFLGTFPTAILVARRGDHDVLAEGSGNPGASNVARLMGWRWGILVLAGDFAKGAITALVGLAVAGRAGAYALGAAAVVGHMLPATRRFKGGKGVATAGGMLAMLFPLIAAGLAVVWFVIARLLRLASVASLVAAAAFPIAAAVLGYDVREVAVLAALALLVFTRHASNLRRLVHGAELTTEHPREPGSDADAA